MPYDEALQANDSLVSAAGVQDDPRGNNADLHDNTPLTLSDLCTRLNERVALVMGDEQFCCNITGAWVPVDGAASTATVITTPLHRAPSAAAAYKNRVNGRQYKLDTDSACGDGSDDANDEVET